MEADRIMGRSTTVLATENLCWSTLITTTSASGLFSRYSILFDSTCGDSKWGKSKSWYLLIVSVSKSANQWLLNSVFCYTSSYSHLNTLALYRYILCLHSHMRILGHHITQNRRIISMFDDNLAISLYCCYHPPYSNIVNYAYLPTQDRPPSPAPRSPAWQRAPPRPLRWWRGPRTRSLGWSRNWAFEFHERKRKSSDLRNTKI